MNSSVHKLLIIASFITFVSCKKKDNPASPIIKVVPVVTVPVPTEDKVLIPVKLEIDKGIIDFKYLQQTGILTEIDYSDGTKELYAYDENNHLKRYDRYSAIERIYTVYYKWDQQGNVIQANQNKVESNGTYLTPIGIYKIEYNTENRISKITWYDNNDHQLSQSIRTYTKSGAALKTSTTGQNAFVYNYTFDEKNGWCKQVKFSQVLSIESLNSLFLSSTGNMTKASDEAVTAADVSYSYIFNSDNYPASWIQTDAKGAKKTYKVTYR
jgi:hypothetical protein